MRRAISSSVSDYENAVMIETAIREDVMAACPGAGRSALLAALKKLTEEKVIVKSGTGRSTYHVRSDALE